MSETELTQNLEDMLQSLARLRAQCTAGADGAMVSKHRNPSIK